MAHSPFSTNSTHPAYIIVKHANELFLSSAEHFEGAPLWTSSSRSRRRSWPSSIAQITVVRAYKNDEVANFVVPLAPDWERGVFKFSDFFVLVICY